jgi:hypothetical protein
MKAIGYLGFVYYDEQSFTEITDIGRVRPSMAGEKFEDGRAARSYITFKSGGFALSTWPEDKIFARIEALAKGQEEI